MSTCTDTHKTGKLLANDYIPPFCANNTRLFYACDDSRSIKAAHLSSLV